jgi:hypothetical protein
MAFQFAPLLMGAGIGALGGLLTGQDPLKAAAIGGATGGLFGNIPAGSWMGGSASVAGSTAPTGMGVSLAPASLADDALSLSPTLNSAVPTGMGINLASAPAGMGVENIGQYATGTGTNLMAAAPTMWDEISPYMNVRDLTGAGLVAAQYQQRPQLPTAPSGGISRGQAPQGTDVMALLAGVKPREQRRISLL